MANEVTNFNIGGVDHAVKDEGGRALIAAIQEALDALTGGDTTTAIETFQEVIDFLSGVTDDETLIGKMNELRTLINAKYSKPSTGIPKTDLSQDVQNVLDNAGSGEGTVTAVKMNNGTPIEPDENGVVNLGTVITQHQDISGKVDKVTGKGLSTNDYTTAEKNKLAGIAEGAEVNVQPDWSQTNTNAKDYIKNKPTILSQQQVAGMIEDAIEDMPTGDIPTKVSDLENDEGYIKASQMDNAPTAGSNNPVKSGGIKTALDNLLQNLTIGSNGNWFVGQTDTHIKAQGPKGDDGEDGTLTLQEGETPTLSIVADLNTDDDLSDNIKVLSAGMGKKLGIRTRVVLDDVDSDYNGTDNMPSAQDVGSGLTVHCADDKIRHYYVDNNVVKLIESVPDPDLVYCLTEGNIIMRWDAGNGTWQRIGNGGGVTVNKGNGFIDLIFGASGGSENIGLPKITFTPSNLVFDSATSGQTKTIVVKAKNLTSGGTIQLSSGDSQFVLSENTISVDDAKNGVTITVTCNGIIEKESSITATCEADGVSASAEVSYISPYAFTSADNAPLCTALHNSGITASSDGVLKSEVGSITSLPGDFMKNNSSLTTLNQLELLTSLASIGVNAFATCQNLSSIKFPSSLTTISQAAFSNCKFTGTLALPASCTSMGKQAFYYCDSSSGFSISLGSITSIGQNAFTYSSVKSVVIPSTCTSIGAAAFYSCSKLSSITFEGSPTSFGGSAFEGIKSSAVVTIKSSTPPTLNADFAPSVSGMTLRVPSDAVSTYQEHTYWGKFGTIEAITE